MSRLEELLRAISENPDYEDSVFEAAGVYFVITNGAIWEIPDDSGGTPRGGCFPDIVSGLSSKEKGCLFELMEAVGFGEDFFGELIECYGEFEDSDAEAYFEENEDEDSLETYRRLTEMLEGDDVVFDSAFEVASALERRELDHGRLYYKWEGEFIDLYDNICETGEKRGYYDNKSDEEWIHILESIDTYRVKI